MSKVARLRAALLELLEEHERDGALPTSARFLFYEMVQRGVLSKERRTPGRRPDQDMSDALTDLRESGEVPWSWIVDETRSLDSYTGALTLRRWLLEVLPQARLDPWGGNVPLILCESRSLAGVLRATVRDYAAEIAATNGHSLLGNRRHIHHGLHSLSVPKDFCTQKASPKKIQIQMIALIARSRLTTMEAKQRQRKKQP